jgi:hypothetical protein
MEHYLAERYVPAHLSASLGDDVARVRAAASAEVQLLESWYVPEDEICFLLFASASADLVERTMLEANLELARVMQVRR